MYACDSSISTIKSVQKKLQLNIFFAPLTEVIGSYINVMIKIIPSKLTVLFMSLVAVYVHSVRSTQKIRTIAKDTGGAHGILRICLLLASRFTCASSTYR